MLITLDIKKKICFPHATSERKIRDNEIALFTLQLPINLLHVRAPSDVGVGRNEKLFQIPKVRQKACTKRECQLMCAIASG